MSDENHTETSPQPEPAMRPGWHIAVLLLVPLIVVIALELLHVPELIHGLLIK